MANFIFSIFCFIFINIIFAQPAFAQSASRYTNCDMCGYCLGRTVPQSWESCRLCLYPSANPTPSSKSTLLITNDVAVTPVQGHYYTTLGCFSTNLGLRFDQPGAAGNVTQRLLTIIFSVAGGIAFLYLIYGSFLVLTSQADPDKLNHGKKVIYGSIIGVIFTVSAIFIINLIANTILKIPGFGQ